MNSAWSNLSLEDLCDLMRCRSQTFHASQYFIFLLDSFRSDLVRFHLMNSKEREEDQPPLFESGQIVATPGALQALAEAEQTPREFLIRHLRGDWGDLDDEDKKENDLSLEQGSRLLSAYHLTTGVKIWIITESDRSVTTFLLPDEY